MSGRSTPGERRRWIIAAPTPRYRHGRCGCIRVADYQEMRVQGSGFRGSGSGIRSQASAIARPPILYPLSSILYPLSSPLHLVTLSPCHLVILSLTGRTLQRVVREDCADQQREAIEVDQAEVADRVEAIGVVQRQRYG